MIVIICDLSNIKCEVWTFFNKTLPGFQIKNKMYSIIYHVVESLRSLCVSENKTATVKCRWIFAIVVMLQWSFNQDVFLQ